MIRTSPPLVTLAFALALGACGQKGASSAKEPADPVAQKEVEEEPSVKAKRLARELLIVDGHVDLPYRLHDMKEAGREWPDLSVRGGEGDFDGVRSKEGGLDAPFMSIYIPAKYQKQGGAKALADELIDSVESVAEKYGSYFALARTPEAVFANKDQGKVSLLMGIENGAAIEDELANVQHFFDRGVRYITLTHAKDNLICDSSYDRTGTHAGLSEFGAKVVAEMNRVGIMVDISHVSDEAFYDVLKVSSKPVIASHSSLRHFVPSFERNMSDEMVKALAASGGVIMINFGSTFVTEEANSWGERSKEAEKKHFGGKEASTSEREAFAEKWKGGNPFPFAQVSDVADHIDRVVQLVGVEHVGFGSDFDGVGDSLPMGLKDVSMYPKLIEELIVRGYTDADIEAIASGNILRVWRAQEHSGAI